MVKIFLNKIISLLFYNNERKRIEKYLSQSNDLADLENRMKELDRAGIYIRY